MFHSISSYHPTPLTVMDNPWIQWCVVLPRDIGDELRQTPEVTQVLRRFENERQPLMKQIAASTPLTRMGRADEIAAVVAFLCSKDASYVTGVDWLVDGGATYGFQAAVEGGEERQGMRGH